MIGELKRLYEARPFRPFEIELDDNQVFPVDLPEFIGWSEDAGVLMIADASDAISTLPLARVKIIRPVDKPRVKWAR